MYIEASAHAFALYTQDSPMNTEISSLVVGPDAYEHTGMRFGQVFYISSVQYNNFMFVLKLC